jgi:hypothetical protein
MGDPRARCPVVLDRLPADLLHAAVTYLADILRECQLVLVDRLQGVVHDPELCHVAEGLVPDLEEVADAFTGADLSLLDDGSVRVETVMESAQSGVLANVQIQLVQLRLLGRRGGLLVRSDPEVTQFIAWIWDEAADQLHGRAARPYRPPR